MDEEEIIQPDEVYPLKKKDDSIILIDDDVQNTMDLSEHNSAPDMEPPAITNVQGTGLTGLSDLSVRPLRPRRWPLHPFLAPCASDFRPLPPMSSPRRPTPSGGPAALRPPLRSSPASLTAATPYARCLLHRRHQKLSLPPPTAPAPRSACSPSPCGLRPSPRHSAPDRCSSPQPPPCSSWPSLSPRPPLSSPAYRPRPTAVPSDPDLLRLAIGDAPPCHRSSTRPPPERRSLATGPPTGHQTPFLALSGGDLSK
ncbi:vegetative cell wall protein gp1-like [Cryptomeria japonica]|uniref:vegetative cell wall protein gp1-like n=1 Tax=Cryptomeria japonica TaxID=3369 RepID=UPI0027D9F1DF|nr:vegetative cell wall protein gp1-like [Cryptomeria japonica]